MALQLLAICLHPLNPRFSARPSSPLELAICILLWTMVLSAFKPVLFGLVLYRASRIF